MEFGLWQIAWYSVSLRLQIFQQAESFCFSSVITLLLSVTYRLYLQRDRRAPSAIQEVTTEAKSEGAREMYRQLRGR